MKAGILNEALFDPSFDTKSTKFGGRSIKREMSSTAMKLRCRSTGDTIRPEEGGIRRSDPQNDQICFLPRYLRWR